MLCCYVYYVDDSKKQNNDGVQHIQAYTYEYDELGQLIEECSRPEQKCTAYAYDLNGNITTKTEYPVDITIKEYIFKNVNPSRTYTYSYNNDLWKDELTSYTRVIHDSSGDRTYTTPANTYDAIGNPKKYFGSDLEWDYGRQLRRFYSGLYDTTYSYNADGMLIKQAVTYNTIPDYPINYSYENFYDGTTLIRRTGQGFDAWFDYDESGSPVGMNVTTTTGSSSNPTVTTTQYYFVKNLQGDIVAIADSTGTIKCRYTYDSWGKVLSVVGPNGTPSLTDHTNPANINPFRYRGYYYDAENQLYWLQSRFYDPNTGRFLNADSQLNLKDGFTGTNLFVYCGNNPVNRVDYTGHFWSEIADFFNSLLDNVNYLANEWQYWYEACGNLALADGPLPFGDVLALAGLALLTAGAVVGGLYLTAQAPAKNISIPKAEEKTITIPKTSNNEIIFPINPHDFNPIGLNKVCRPGTKNGSMISWMDPIKNEEIFRWDENPNFPNGPHYHILGGGHPWC